MTATDDPFDGVHDIRRIQDGFLAEATRRFPRNLFDDDGTFVRRNLHALTGLPDIWSPRAPIPLRGGRYLITDSRCLPFHVTLDFAVDWFWNETDVAKRSNGFSYLIHERAANAIAWLRASPENRVVADSHDAIDIVTVWVYADIVSSRLAPLVVTGSRPSPSISASLLHDVLSTLHGRDRRVAATVCTAWRAAAVDALLPVTDDDVRAWIGPRIAEMLRAYPPFTCNDTALAFLWGLTRWWLQGAA
jgi:hypothetical protein